MDVKGVQRISLSLPPDIYNGLEALVEARGYDNRSQAVTDILRQELVLHRSQNPEEVMAGSITLFYHDAKPGLSEKLSKILRSHLKDVVSSLNVLLENSMRMEILVVQGPVRVLESLLADLIALKGVQTGKLTLTSAILPPLYEKTQGAPV